MTDEKWNVFLAKALHEAQISAAFLQCRYRAVVYFVVYFEQQLVDRTLLLLLKNWAAVQAVADALLRHRRIEVGRVQSIIDRSSP